MGTNDKKDGLHLFTAWKPGMEAGEYTIAVKQTVDYAPGSQWIFTPPEQKFTVGALRYSLAQEEVLACYPPPGSSLPCDGLLPYISLRSPYLPWERRLSWAGVPWVALVLLAEGEAPAGDIRTGQAGELLDGNKASNTLVLPSTGPPPAETACTTIDLEVPLLQKLMPENPAKELPLLAHVRQQHEPAAGASRARSACSCIVGNRFARTLPSGSAEPRRPCHYTAHLVSLVGHEQNLQKIATLDQAKKVRLLSLFSWSFTSVSPQEPSYTEAFQGLKADSKTSHNRLRCTPAIKPNDAVDKRLQAGYVPVAHRLASGEKTLSWYRGPLAPEPSGTSEHTPYNSADEALMYTADQGIFDISMAAAWTVGCQLILSRTDLCDQMLTLSTTAAQHAMALAAATHPATADSSLDFVSLNESELSAEGLTDLTEPTALWRRFERAMAEEDLGTQITQALAGPVMPGTPDTEEPVGAITPETGTEHSQVSLLEHAVGLLEQEEASTALRTALRSGFLPPAEKENVLGEATEIPVATALGTESEVWLWDPVAMLSLLPTWHLLPLAQAVLPMNSARFFHIDQSWMQAFADGMLSIGTHTSLDYALADHLKHVSFNLRPDSVAAACGLLIRSHVIRHWPQDPPPPVDISGNPKDQKPDENEMIFSARRMTSGKDEGVRLITRRQLGPDTVLLLFNKVPTDITLREPPHALQFGVNGPSDDHGQRTLRNKDGKTITASINVFDHFLRGPVSLTHSPEVLKVEALLTEMINKSSTGAPANSAAFALQMLNPPAVLEINPPST
ncbi:MULTISPECIES: hypothetical protein [Streptomyces]|uniref:hypothetical protein n=1 Tax=Streptomyces TaxID=1883 RepID=UPI00345C1F2F